MLVSAPSIALVSTPVRAMSLGRSCVLCAHSSPCPVLRHHQQGGQRLPGATVAPVQRFRGERGGQRGALQGCRWPPCLRKGKQCTMKCNALHLPAAEAPPDPISPFTSSQHGGVLTLRRVCLLCLCWLVPMSSSAPWGSHTAWMRSSRHPLWCATPSSSKGTSTTLSVPVRCKPGPAHQFMTCACAGVLAWVEGVWGTETHPFLTDLLSP